MNETKIITIIAAILFGLVGKYLLTKYQLGFGANPLIMVASPWLVRGKISEEFSPFRLIAPKKTSTLQRFILLFEMISSFFTSIILILYFLFV